VLIEFGIKYDPITTSKPLNYPAILISKEAITADYLRRIACQEIDASPYTSAC
jgi:hypothetical protein